MKGVDMSTSLKVGNKELFEPYEMPESIQKVFREVLAQNRMILEENCRIMRLISMCSVIVPSDQPKGGD